MVERRAEIVRVAVELLDEQGLEAVSGTGPGKRGVVA
jgi:DNA-binding transcriptional regulator YbjK